MFYRHKCYRIKVLYIGYILTASIYKKKWKWKFGRGCLNGFLIASKAVMYQWDTHVNSTGATCRSMHVHEQCPWHFPKKGKHLLLEGYRACTGIYFSPSVSLCRVKEIWQRQICILYLVLYAKILLELDFGFYYEFKRAVVMARLCPFEADWMACYTC